MKLKTTYFIVAAILVIIYVTLCFFGPVKYVAKQSKKLNASSVQLSGLIGDFNYWKEWNPDVLDTTNKYEIQGLPFTVGHEMKMNRYGVDEKLTLRYMFSDSAKVDEIFIQRVTLSQEENKGWMKFTFGEAPKSMTVLTIEMEQGEIPFLFRGMIWMMQSANPLDKHVQACLENMDRLVNGEINLDY